MCSCVCVCMCARVCMLVCVMYMGISVSRCLKEELAWVTDKHPQIIRNIMSFKTKELKNEDIFCFNSVVWIAMWSLVMYSNCVIVYYRLMLHGYWFHHYIGIITV